jgi:hypothetical protein|tara:strand:+ start:275 stop:469 length:195 start_codon:yes stop_codon:yes gene_type:complete
MKTKIKIAIQMLNGMLEWSDRIGSDEIYEIKEIRKQLVLALEENNIREQVVKDLFKNNNYEFTK